MMSDNRAKRVTRGSISVQVEKDGNPRFWRLKYTGDAIGEVVLTVPGILTSLNLHMNLKDVP